MGTHWDPWEPMDFMDFPWIDCPWIFHELSGRPEADIGVGWGGVELGGAAPAASPKIQNPWGGKSMGWEILGKSMSNRYFGKPDFGKKSRFENKLVVFRKKKQVFGNLYNVQILDF